MNAALRNLPVRIAVLLLLGTLLSGCGSPQSPPAPSKPAETRPAEWTAIVAEATGGADPFTEYGTNSQFALIPHVIEPLMHAELLPDGKAWGIVNDLAESWTFADPTTLRVELKRGVRFQNGEELTAEHVKYAYDSIVFVPQPGRRANTLKALGDAEIVDPYTVVWHLPVPNRSVLSFMDRLLIPPLARRTMTAEEFEARPIGTGPYKAVEWPRDGTIRLEAWDGHRRGKPFPERLVIRSVPEPSTRVLELLAGTAQIAQAVPIEGLASIEGNPKLEVAALRGSTTLSYVINVFKAAPPLRDKRVRQAMNYAVDREGIVRSILGGRGTMLPGPLWPGWIGYTDDVKPYPHDPERARALLREAGYPDGFTFRWSVTQGVFTKDIEVAQAVASQLARVGITASLQPLERARVLAERNEGAFDVTELVWPMYWDPSTIYVNTLQASYPDAKLVPQFGPPPAELVEARRLVNEAAAAPSTEQMASTYAAANRLMHDDAFWLFVHTMDELWATQKDVGWRPYPTSYPFYYDYWAMLGKKTPSEATIPLILN
jgi:peptide/nickel transport system substrate-binding protein